MHQHPLVPIVHRIGTVALAAAGAAMLFAADELMPRLAEGFPPAAAWTGQLLGAAWLATAAGGWLQRSVVMGGIYGRPVVMPLCALHFISALTLVGAPAAPRALVVPFAVFAGFYAVLLFRGPIPAPDTTPAPGDA